MIEPVDTDIYENDELKHWGIIGMKWGIRRFQNEDGSLTPEGMIRYGRNKNAKQNYINDNWDRAKKIIEEEMLNDNKFKKFVEDRNYKEYRTVKYEDDPNYFSKYYRPDIYAEQGYAEDFIDYDTILLARTQELLENEYNDLLEKEYNRISHSDSELKHYRTLGSKNGVRLYQRRDGSLTALGELRYLKGEKVGNKHYYETGYKPGFLDVYGRRKQNELKKYIKNNGGNKNYKGYQRAEDKELKYQDPKKKRFEMHVKIQTDKPNARRQRVNDLNKALDQIQKNYERDQESWLTRESSDDFVNKKRRSLISGILSNDKYLNTGKNFFISIAKDPSIFGLVKYFINNNQKSNPIDNNFQNQEIHDEHANSYEAWAHIGKKRIKDLFSAGKDRLKREKKENERSVGLLGLGKMHWDPHIDSYKNKKRSNNFRISKNELKK